MSSGNEDVDQVTQPDHLCYMVFSILFWPVQYRHTITLFIES